MSGRDSRSSAVLNRELFDPYTGASSLARLSNAVDSLKQDIGDILAHRDDSLEVARQTPELCRQLEMEQMPQAQQRAAALIHQYAREHSTRAGLVSKPLIEALVRVLHKSSDEQVQMDTALSLQHISKIEAAAREIIVLFPIETLLQMLGHPSDIIIFTAISILHQFLRHFHTQVIDEVRALHGPKAIADLFHDPAVNDSPNLDPAEKEGFVRIIIVAADTLRILAYEHQPTKLILLSSGLNTQLVRILQTQNRRDKLRFAVARLIKVLSVCPDNKNSLVSAGAVQALGNLLFSKHPTLILEALWGLRNLSDVAYHLTDTRQLFQRLIQLLASREEHMATCAAGCLCNFTCQNPDNKVQMIELGGIKALCTSLVENASREEVTEPVCSALRHATHHNSHSEAATYQIKQNAPAMETIVNLLSYEDEANTTLLPLIKASLGLVRNLALDRDARKTMRGLNVVARLAKVLLVTKRLLQQQIDEMGSRFSVTYSEPLNEETLNLLFIEGVRIDEMLELTLAALHSMAKDQSVREELAHTPGILTSAVQVLYSRSEALQRAAVGFLSELSVSSRVGQAIEREGAVPRLTELIQSSNEAIAAYSAAILHRGAHHKPEDYRRRLNQELRQSLFDGGVLNDESLMMMPDAPTATQRTITPVASIRDFITPTPNANILDRISLNPEINKRPSSQSALSPAYMNNNALRGISS